MWKVLKKIGEFSCCYSVTGSGKVLHNEGHLLLPDYRCVDLSYECAYVCKCLANDITNFYMGDIRDAINELLSKVKLPPRYVHQLRENVK